MCRLVEFLKVEEIEISEKEKLEWQEKLIFAVANASSIHDLCKLLGIEIAFVGIHHSPYGEPPAEEWEVKFHPKLQAFIKSLEQTHLGYFPDEYECFLPNGDILMLGGWEYDKVLPIGIMLRLEWEAIQREMEEQAKAAYDEMMDEEL